MGVIVTHGNGRIRRAHTLSLTVVRRSVRSVLLGAIGLANGSQGYSTVTWVGVTGTVRIESANGALSPIPQTRTFLVPSPT
jgi:hypothetical protein